MKVELLNYTPLWVSAKAIRTCWASEGKSDTILEYCTGCNKEVFQCSCCSDDSGETITIIGEKDKALIERVGNKFKHSSTLEHLNYSFSIEGISRACLQELARHRIASLSVKSTRYTLKELKNEAYLYNTNPVEVDWHWDLVEKYCVLTSNEKVNESIAKALSNLKDILEDGTSNDIAKYCLPEAYKTSLAWTINARSLQNFLSLRTSKSALWEIRDLANEIFNKLPIEHKYLFDDSLYDEDKVTVTMTKRQHGAYMDMIAQNDL